MSRCLRRIGFEREVLFRHEADARADGSSGELTAFECPCEAGVWHVFRPVLAARAFSDSGP